MVLYDRIVDIMTSLVSEVSAYVTRGRTFTSQCRV